LDIVGLEQRGPAAGADRIFKARELSQCWLLCVCVALDTFI